MHEKAPIRDLHQIFVDPPIVILLTDLDTLLGPSVKVFPAPALGVDYAGARRRVPKVAGNMDMGAAISRGARDLIPRLIPEVILGRARDGKIKPKLGGYEGKGI